MSFGDEVPAGATYEAGVLEGVERGHVLALRTEAKGNARIAALRAMIREARQQIFDVIATLPAEERGKLAGVVQILTALSTREP